ncbi:MAG TPA: hypothetical protein VF467_16930 [Afipia sp.]
MLIAVGALFAALSAAVPAVPPARSLDTVQSSYVEHCGGCHGIQGSSFPARVPRLRGRAGFFLCTAETRQYLLRLPNVALASMDDQRLADTMNFVVFGLGGTSAIVGAPRFTASEVARERGLPLSGVSLIRARQKAVRQISARCGVKAEALQF